MCSNHLASTSSHKGLTSSTAQPVRRSCVVHVCVEGCSSFLWFSSAGIVWVCVFSQVLWQRRSRRNCSGRRTLNALCRAARTEEGGQPELKEQPQPQYQGEEQRDRWVCAKSSILSGHHPKNLCSCAQLSG
jgi:hypothetical protein